MVFIMNNSIIISSINSVIKYNKRYCLQLDNSVYTNLIDKVNSGLVLSNEDNDMIIHCLKLSLNILLK